MEESSEWESWTWEYLEYLLGALLLLKVGPVSVTVSGSEGREPVDSVSEADEWLSEPWSAFSSGEMRDLYAA